ncbi:hypothetical protein DAPPUDRAFT_328176 [Daphnia pulex]|uniref:Chitin-binding type-2 domain-containing protein n=1 Tax=Daphnia pulex TaxID=6669 RepID=E9HD55_DAPPU|nr:hypothetical protein DAPPUDRAFT_328176 [Daphnia pulex]|eukprot:EFX70307.1 hypothetical protein DAPPUDRAFT_328176 [Daphnia pulex]
MKCPSTLATVATLVLFQVCLGQLASAGLLHDRLLAKEDFVCPSDGFHAVPGTCSGSYYSCVNGFPYLMTCPGSAVFDPALSACVPPGDASCNQAFQCPAQGGFYAIPGTCGGNYYSCINGVAYVLTCPGSSIFDPAVGVCVPKEVASCLDETTTPTVSTVSPTPTPVSTTTTTQSPGTFTCPSEFGFFPTGIPCDDDFWRCSNGLSYLMSCPPTTIWYQDQTICDYPYNVPGCA